MNVKNELKQIQENIDSRRVDAIISRGRDKPAINKHSVDIKLGHKYSLFLISKFEELNAT